MFITKKLSL